jgi:diacylglycerol kinase family enzyme
VWDLLTDASGTFGKDVMIGFARGREIRVELAGGEVQPVQMDGDPGGETPFTATAVPAAIQVMMPRT